MKEVLAFFMAYPLWVKITLVLLLAACCLLLIVFKPLASASASTPDVGGVSISVGSNVGGIIAGGSVVVHPPHIGPDTSELVGVLNLRAQKITAELSDMYKYVSAKAYLKEFQGLHAAHVEALSRGHLIEAHEILGKIHELSFKLEREEFWTHHRKTMPPGVHYSLRRDAFKKGPMVVWYAGQPLVDAWATTLVFTRNESEPRPSKTSVEDTYASLLASAAD